MRQPHLDRHHTDGPDDRANGEIDDGVLFAVSGHHSPDHEDREDSDEENVEKEGCETEASEGVRS